MKLKMVGISLCGSLRGVGQLRYIWLVTVLVGWEKPPTEDLLKQTLHFMLESQSILESTV